MTSHGTTRSSWRSAKVAQRLEGFKYGYIDNNQEGNLLTGKRWSIEEISVLVANFGIIPIREWINLLPGRSWEAIQAKSLRIGLVSNLRGPFPRYSAPDITAETFDEIWEAVKATP